MLGLLIIWVGLLLALVVFAIGRAGGGGALTLTYFLGLSLIHLRGVLPLLPVATLVTGGFLGYGAIWALSVLVFLFVISRRRIWFYVCAPAAVFLGLSLFVTYMGERVGIREVVSQGKTSLLDRFDRVSALVT